MDTADIEEWAVNANEALTIVLVKNDGSSSEFNPKFTYPIFGDQELIYGYKGLELVMKMDAKCLRAHVSLTYQEKLPEANITDLLAVLQQFLSPDTVYDDEDVWRKEVDAENLAPGEIVNSFTLRGDKYVVYKASIQQAKTLHLRMRVLVLLFIEAGSYIDDSDPRWELYTVYKTSANGELESFVGFCTVYPYFWYHDAKTHDEESSTDSWPMRKRISQFVILPPFQGLGIGGALYSSLVDRIVQDHTVREITVEDPSEAFDDLRDRCDLQRLARLGLWADLKLPLEPQWIENMRRTHKMAPRQFARCLEMALLHNLGKPDKPYRLFVKRRLFTRNQEALNDLDDRQRKDKLQETFDRLIEDYYRIMEGVDFSHLHKGKKRMHE